MKKISFFVTGLFALVVWSNAQNTSPYWSLAGNSNATSSSKLGTTNAINLRFFTNNTERARITSSGLIGIGTTSPVTKFHVNGISSFGANVTGANATRVVNLVDGNAVMRILRVHATAAPAVELLSRTTSDGSNVAYWDAYAEPSDASFRIRDRKTSLLDRLTINSNGYVGIGTTTPSYKLHSEASGVAVYGNSTSGSYGVWGNSTYLGVYGSATSYGVYGYGTSGYGIYGYGNTGVFGNSNNSSYGVYGTSSTSYNANGSTGVYGAAYYGVHGVGTYGVWGESSNSGYGVYGSSNYLGVWGSAPSYGVYGSSDNYGIYGSSGYIGTYGSATSYGVYGYSSAGWGVAGYSTSNYGVYGESNTGNGGKFYSVDGYGLWAATGRTDNNWAGVFDGDVYTYNNYETSDKNLKKNIQEFGDAMSIINKLKPKNYEFVTEGKLASLNLPKGHHYGLIAQDVELVLPNLVKESVHDLNFMKSRPKMIKPSGDGKTPAAIQTAPEQTDTKDNVTLKAINYTELIPIIVKGMQELYTEKDKKINDLQQQINDLKAMVQALTKQGNGTALSTGFLKQNVPNPASNNTVISYYIPDNAGNAQIKITDVKGSLIKIFNAAKGEGQINIRNSQLPAGTYNYTLYINSKTVDTKQMVLIK